MEKKYMLLGSGVAGLAALVVVLLIVIAALGALFLEGGPLNFLLGKDKTKLDIESDPMLFTAKLHEEGVTLTSAPENYCLTCEITYAESGPMETTLTSEELTSYLQATNNEKGPLKNIQVKLGDDNNAEATADVDLSEYGYDISGPVYAKGRLEKTGPTSVGFRVYEANIGPLPVPASELEKGENAIENRINQELSEMPGLRIDTLEIKDGELLFEGDFPKKISAQ